MTRDNTDEKQLIVRRGRVDSVDLYEIKDSELDVLEHGGPASLYLNFAIFLISIAASAVTTIATTTSFRHPMVATLFLLVAVVGTIGGAFLLLLWRRERAAVVAVIAKIRSRIPPDVIPVSDTATVSTTTTTPAPIPVPAPPRPTG